MRKFILATSIVLFIIISGFHSSQIFSDSQFLVIEDFQKYNGKPFPDWNFREDYNQASSVYSIVEEDGRKFLKGSTVNARYMVQLGKQVNENNLIGRNKVSWDILSYPYISWDWRVRILPTGGDETDTETNDSAASIYVVFQRSRVPFAGWQYQPANWIKYVWSSTLPVGTVISRKISRFGIALYEGKYIVVASGKNNIGKWITFKRNVLADYEKHFGAKPDFNPIVIGILTDSNTTNSEAEADYDNIRAFSY